MKGIITKIGAPSRHSVFNVVGEAHNVEFPQNPEVNERFYVQEDTRGLRASIWSTSVVLKIEKKSPDEWILNTVHSVYRLNFSI